MRNGECGNVAMANVIKKLFGQLLGQYFQQVPSNPYYMFFNEDQSDNGGSVSANMSEDADDENETDSQVSVFITLTLCLYGVIYGLPNAN